MTDEAKPLSAAPVSRPRIVVSRIAQYVLLQIIIAALCILALRHPLPEPPARYLLTVFTLHDRGATREVMLPAFVPSRSGMDDPAMFTGSFGWTHSDAGGAWSVYLPRFTNGVEVIVNGTSILDSRRDPSANRPDRDTPEIAVIPASLLHDGANELAIRLYVWGPISGFLDRPFVGPDDVLRPYFEQRTLWFVTLPTVFSAWQGILAVILVVLWAVRRHEIAYGMLAGAMALGAMQTFLVTVVDQPRHPELNATLIASAPLESGFVLAFAILFFTRRWPRHAALVFVPGVLVMLAGLLGTPQLLRTVFMVLGIPAIGINLLLLAAVVAWSELRRQDVPSLLLGCAVTIVITCLAHDLLEVAQILPDRRIFFSRLSYSVLLIAIGAGLTWRFAGALNRVDGFAAHLVIQLREAEEKLRAAFAREQEQARAAELARERTRLMRDLHDGLGGQLVSIVALSERGEDTGGIGDAARAALKDLRLVIDSMDDIGGDLMLALGSWRDRVAAQLRPHGIALNWQITPPGLPVHPELRPSHVIQIVRLLDEAVTNAVKHAGARTITVRIATLNDATGPYGSITVRDDGKGFAPAAEGSGNDRAAGRGLRNMQTRAARCGATCEVVSSATGTRVRLTLPHRFPDGDIR
ncbi:MAG TPA: ATP-binding protein [Bradyrhizobium sp.]|nr:ATP-binding protein [Bradyrhizobium sp.]